MSWNYFHGQHLPCSTLEDSAGAFDADFVETPIKAVAEDLNAYTVYIRNGSGNLAFANIRMTYANPYWSYLQLVWI
ncbi:hypothetical protein CIPAW_05G140800 [Carya illinoinensis]|uniref:Uncharacterized protein n=1 Tax=Carya illinoinensis TaxID=32201 RepID=A0A8T1QJG0_CARIL|nr:hypothetical protein CIPAW_05G140800 [Carya illinoinensis]